eukprot:TRINITY_DN21838_c0_g1_i4.p1 TRINITY_DN21838_c0_g1~~TRINITY_DN21838_c0_g1_i4.p1  ORF type:complete len:432 (-),score=63.49 TRINITY_DN21838_c0_g1_i4:315-1610(-)
MSQQCRPTATPRKTAPASLQKEATPFALVTVTVGGRSFRENTCALAKGSLVFRAMLESKMRERLTEKIVLPGKSAAEYAVFRKFFRPLANVQDVLNAENVDMLLPWFHEYQMPAMLHECEKVLKKQPVTAERLVQAHSYQLEGQYTRCLYFVAEGFGKMKVAAVAKNKQVMADLVSCILRRKSMARHGYMAKQAHITAKMRGVLVDWLVDVNRAWKLQEESLYLAVSIIDRCLDARPDAWPKKYLQLLGVTAMLLEAKPCDMANSPPLVSCAVRICDKAYTTREVEQMQSSIRKLVDLRKCRITAYDFLLEFHCLTEGAKKDRDLAQYVLELALPEYDMLKHKPAKLAAGAIMLRNKLLQKTPAWPSDIACQCHTEEQEVEQCALDMYRLLQKARTSGLQAVQRKFSLARFHGVSKLDFPPLQFASGPSVA